MNKFKTFLLVFFSLLIAAVPAEAQRKLPPTAIDGRIPNAQAQATNILSSGNATPSTATFVLAAESGTSDDAVNILTTNFKAGDTLKVIADAGDTIALKDGTGNITTDTGADVTLTDSAYLLLDVTASGVRVNRFGGSNVVKAGTAGSEFYYFETDPDAAATNYPDFAVDSRYSQTKTVAKSILLGDPGDTADLGFFCVDGTPASPSRRTAPYPCNIIYSWPMDNLGSYVPSGIDYGSGEAGGQNPYYGRNAQIYMPITETPTASARPGAIVFGTTRSGQAYSRDVGWFSDTGNLILGGGATDEGVSYPFDPTALDIDRKNSPSTNDVTYDTVDGWGNLSIIATDDSDRAAIAIRKSSDVANYGMDIKYDHGGEQIKFQRNNNGVFSDAIDCYITQKRCDLFGLTLIEGDNSDPAYAFFRNTSGGAGGQYYGIGNVTNQMAFYRSAADSLGSLNKVAYFDTAGDFYLYSEDAGAGGNPDLRLWRNSASPADSDVLGRVVFLGNTRDGGGALVTSGFAYSSIEPFVVDSQDTTEDARIDFNNRLAGSLTTVMQLGAGLVVGAPTGGDKGYASINASNVYDDNAILTDYVFDKFAGLSGVYSDRVQAKYDALDVDMFAPEKYAAFWKDNGRLYGFPDQNDVIDGVYNVPLGDLVQRLIQDSEIQAIHIDGINTRLTHLETDYGKTKKRMAELFCLLADNEMEACEVQ